jgi:hypothetical protein
MPPSKLPSAAETLQVSNEIDGVWLKLVKVIVECAVEHDGLMKLY